MRRPLATTTSDFYQKGSTMTTTKWTMKNYRRIVIIGVIVLAVILIVGVAAQAAPARAAARPAGAAPVPAAAPQAMPTFMLPGSVTVVRKAMISGDYFEDYIGKGSAHKRKFRASAFVYYTSTRHNGSFHHLNTTKVRVSVNFAGTHMRCAAGGAGGFFFGGHYATRFTFYYKDDRGHNYSNKVTVPCESDTYSTKTKRLYNGFGYYEGAKWKANVSVDLRGEPDEHGTVGKYFRRW